MRFRHFRFLFELDFFMVYLYLSGRTPQKAPPLRVVHFFNVNGKQSTLPGKIGEAPNNVAC